MRGTSCPGKGLWQECNVELVKYHYLFFFGKVYKVKRVITGIILFGYIFIGFFDALLHDQKTYSSIMGMDIKRVYLYTFLLLVIGCWLLYHKWFTGIGFLSLASFSSYFFEFHFLHNYVASILIYIGIVLDIVIRRKQKWLFPFIIIGIIQGISFQTGWFRYYMVGCMEFLALCTGSVFIVRNMGGQEP